MSDSNGRLPTPSQTIGPFFHDATASTGSHVLATEDAEGERIRIHGLVLDADGDGVDDALVEIWQADARGRYLADSVSGGAFSGFGRSDTVEGGRFEFLTVKPGRATGADSAEAPFVAVRVFARGLLRAVVTRLYFADEANEADPVLSGVEAERQPTLIAPRDDSTTPPSYRFDIRLQGDGETVFFDL